MISEALIPLGRLVNTHATRGELRLLLINPASDILQPGMQVVLRRDTHSEERTIVATRPHKRFLLITLEGCDSLNAAEELVGCELCVPENKLPSLNADEIYHYQLIGMRVLTTAGEDLGRVDEVMDLPANDVCIVRGGGREYLIPLIADVVKEIDSQQGHIIIEPLPGLLDI